jgi:polyisoprenoid-binding protein YceI
VHTFAGFRVRHMLVGRVDGRFNTIEGEFVVSADAERLFDRIDVRVDGERRHDGGGARRGPS